jgi:hypothetical protein
MKTAFILVCLWFICGFFVAMSQHRQSDLATIAMGPISMVDRYVDLPKSRFG